MSIFKEKAMKNEKWIDGLMVWMLLLVLLLPVLNINRVPGLISENENRKLAAFPQVFNESGELNDGLRSGFESWFNDNIGFRDSFLRIATHIKVKLLHISTSEKVHIGKDGWYFYRMDHNLEIASGEYPLPEEMLREIAQKQQTISDYYASQGIEYFLVLTPSKASVYPEYIGGEDYKVGVSPCDILEHYLEEHTTVQTVNTKTANVAAKEQGKQFLKTDTHWTHRGSYAAYQSVLNCFNEKGIVKSNPISVTFSEQQVRGEFSAMLGSKNVLPLETSSKAEWDPHAIQIQDGSWFEKMERYRKNNNDAKNEETLLFHNNAAEDKTLLIYGDSQWMLARNMPQMLAEHFRNVIRTRIWNPDIGMDQIVRPDVVVWACGERYINNVLRRDLTVPKLANELSEFPQLPAQTADYWIGKHGICLDSYNGQKVGNEDIITLDPESGKVSLVGWAADFQVQKPLSALYLQVGDKIIQCEYGLKRTSVSSHFKNEDLTNTGFAVTFPASYLNEEAGDKLRFVAIGADGSYCYKPVVYQVERP